MAATVSPHNALGVPEPEWIEFFSKHASRVPQLLGSPQEMRDMMEKLKVEATGLIQPIDVGLTVRDTSFLASDGAKIPLRIYTPDGITKPGPSLIYIHGGGWTLGDLNGEDITCRAMCVYGNLVVVSVDYRLAPENPFPRGLEDSWEALLWTISNADALLVDKGCLLLGGSSSGANVTAVLAHRARDKGVNLKAQILRIPATCHIDVYPPELNLRSMEELKDATLLSKRSMELFYGYYNPPDPSSPEVSPLLNENFKGLAPAYIQVAGMDPLRDEGLAYGEKLKAAGIPTRVDVYPGLPHAFVYFPELSGSKKCGADLFAALKAASEGTL
ncbi:alpha/beta hydrolase fold-3 domain protein [Thozetella sp. PMI_491]|nr:alpha/beta hydrolase fold-3 domain protein [Thozetella sp. PMI_491]